jgi:hypothetical protein
VEFGLEARSQIGLLVCGMEGVLGQ